MSKVWYSIHNLRGFKQIEGILYVQSYTISAGILEKKVQASIDSFNKNHNWEERWTIEDAKDRLNNNHQLFLGVDKDDKPLAHVWFNEDLLYNAYINPEREYGYGEAFIKACLNSVKYDTVKLYCDDWNIRAQKFFEKVGFKQDNISK